MAAGPAHLFCKTAGLTLLPVSVRILVGANCFGDHAAGQAPGVLSWWAGRRRGHAWALTLKFLLVAAAVNDLQNRLQQELPPAF